MTNVHIDGDRLCATDLAEKRGVRASGAFRYAASRSGRSEPFPVTRDGANVCVTIAHFARDGGPRDDAAERYFGVRLQDGIAKGPLIAYLYDLGPARGFRLAGLERPAQ
jgi:hypothetical protein